MKKLSFILLIFMIPGFMFGIGKSSSESEREYVQNLTEEEIVKGHAYSKSSSIQKTSNNKTTIKVKRFSGIEEVLVISPKNQNVDVTVSCKVESGALRVVICDKESIVYEFDVNDEPETFRLPSTKGRYFIKTAGKNARYSLEVEVEAKKTELPSFEGTIL